MDLGIAGRRAIVCAASQGLGRACAESLAREGVHLTLNARREEPLVQAAQEIRAAHGVEVDYVAGDLNEQEARDRLLAACPAPDILVCNPGVRQVPGDFRTWSREDWLWWWDAHFHSMIDLISRVTPGMSERRFGRVVSITVSFIKFPQVGFAHSHAARLALSGAIAAMTRELIPPQRGDSNSVAPGLFDTDALAHQPARPCSARQHDVRGDRREPAEDLPRRPLSPPPDECGDLVAFLCGSKAGFITGQNIVNDGGVYQGLF